MIAIAVPMARQMEVNEIVAIAAALGGGIFGDHCSPISDTTILSSMAAATDHIDHVVKIAGKGLLKIMVNLVYRVFEKNCLV